MSGRERALTLERVFDLGLGFQAAQAVLAATELGLFAELAKGPRTLHQLRRALRVPAPPLPDLLDALVALDLLEREGDDGQAVYLNARLADRCFGRDGAGRVAAPLLAAGRAAYRRWDGLAQALRSGAPRTAGAPLSEALRAAAVPALEALVARLDWQGWREVVDVGSGGRLAAVLAARHPELACTSAPAVPAAWPPADAIVFTHVLRDADADGKQALLAGARGALRDGGCLIAIERLLDDRRRTDAQALLLSLDVWLEGGAGAGFSAADFERWCGDAGYARTERFALDGAHTAVLARV